MFKHPRNIIRDPEKVDELEEQAEGTTLQLLRGEITQDEYFCYLNEMREYLDFRRLAADVEPINTNAHSEDCNNGNNKNHKTKMKP